MSMPRSRSGLLVVALVATSLALAAHWTSSAAFVPAPQAETLAPVAQLRGGHVSAAAVAAAAVAYTPPAAIAAPDEYINYRFAGEVESEDVIAYFSVTIAFTFFAFASYFILTKLKII
mmetsp:Transcript_18078/g.49575  ORF Transcript_18078/g.49575 Transcript_18078/m.49575 type:complete len:118 (-) Transcript_18078:90-443(-)